MQKFMFFVCTLAIVSSSYAQETKTYKTKFNGAGKSIVLNIDAKQLDIEGYNGDDVVIEASGLPEVPKEADGLRPLSAAGVENTNIGLSVNANGNILTISTVMKGKAVYKLKIPKELGVSVKKRNSCSCNETGMSISGIEGGLEINTNYEDITLLDVSGPVVANSHQGKIKVVFSDKMPDKPSSIVSYGDHVDVTVSENAKILFSVLSSNGNMFTDLDLKPYTAPVKVEEQAKKEAEGQRLNALRSIAEKDRAADLAGQTATVVGVGSSSSSTSPASAPSFPRGNAYTFSSAGTDWNSANGVYTAYSWNDNERDYPKYVLNEPQTKITLRTTQGNVYLRKKK
jgi:hypothetical protein